MKYFNLILISGFILFSSCKKIEGHKYIKLVNNSDSELLFKWMIYESAPNDNSYDCRYNGEFVDVNSSKDLDIDRYAPWEAVLDTNYLHVVVTDYNLSMQYNYDSCDSIRKYVPILHHYILTVKDLDRIHLTLAYPPEDI